MLTVRELHALIDQRISPRAAEPVPLNEARGRVLADALVATSDQPAFDHSAMDGFAVAVDAVAGRFEIIGETLPGDAPAASLRHGETRRVFTGAALPPHTRVLMQEHVSEENGFITVAEVGRASHVRTRGSAAKAGTLLLEKGSALSPAALAILAAEGVTMPKVFATPNVAHITTGSEIVPPDAPLQPGKIRNTNATLIRALVEESLAAYVAHHHVDESLEAGLEICASPAIAKADVLLVSGGSSVGKHDRTADLLEALGFELVCRKVDCRPGKPLLLGIKGDQIAIGLPGNPVSHFVTFHLFVRRVLLLMAGHTPPRVVHAKLRSSETLESSERETYWPARYEVSRTDLVVSPQPWLDSGHLSALGKVNALIRLPGNQKLPVDDDLVEFIPCLNLTNSIL